MESLIPNSAPTRRYFLATGAAAATACWMGGPTAFASAPRAPLEVAKNWIQNGAVGKVYWSQFACTNKQAIGALGPACSIGDGLNQLTSAWHYLFGPEAPVKWTRLGLTDPREPLAETRGATLTAQFAGGAQATFVITSKGAPLPSVIRGARKSILLGSTAKLVHPNAIPPRETLMKRADHEAMCWGTDLL